MHSLLDTNPVALFGLFLALGFVAGFSWLAIDRRLRTGARRGPAQSLLRPKEESPSEWTAWLPETFSIDVDGIRLRCARAGQGPPLLLLHGIGASLHVWRFVFRPLSANFEVVALDLPGFGFSDAAKDGDYGLDAQAARAQAALDALGIAECGLVGSSMGGAIALWMGKQNPGRFARTAALAPAVDSALLPIGLKSFRAAIPAVRKALGPRAMRLILQRVVARRELIDDASLEAYLKPYSDRKDALQAFIGATDLLGDRRLPKELAAPKGRVLVLYGEKDRLVPRRSIERYLRVAPKAELLEHPHGGHHIMEDEPAWTAAALRAFFSKP